MTAHEWTLSQGPGKTTITCSCGEFTATLGTGFGDPIARESHLKAEHQRHVKETK